MLCLLIILWSAQPARNCKPAGGIATLSVCSLRDLLQSTSYARTSHFPRTSGTDSARDKHVLRSSREKCEILLSLSPSVKAGLPVLKIKVRIENRIEIKCERRFVFACYWRKTKTWFRRPWKQTATDIHWGMLCPPGHTEGWLSFQEVSFETVKVT